MSLTLLLILLEKKNEESSTGEHLPLRDERIRQKLEALRASSSLNKTSLLQMWKGHLAPYCRNATSRGWTLNIGVMSSIEKLRSHVENDKFYA